MPTADSGQRGCRLTGGCGVNVEGGPGLEALRQRQEEIREEFTLFAQFLSFRRITHK